MDFQKRAFYRSVSLHENFQCFQCFGLSAVLGVMIFSGKINETAYLQTFLANQYQT